MGIQTRNKSVFFILDTISSFRQGNAAADIGILSKRAEKMEVPHVVSNGELLFPLISVDNEAITSTSPERVSSLFSLSRRLWKQNQTNATLQKKSQRKEAQDVQAIREQNNEISDK